MTCTFCYDHGVLQVTGHNGELAPVECPGCGISQTSNDDSVCKLLQTELFNNEKLPVSSNDETHVRESVGDNSLTQPTLHKGDSTPVVLTS